MPATPPVPPRSCLRTRLLVTVIAVSAALLALLGWREYGYWVSRLDAAIADSGKRALALAADESRLLRDVERLVGRMAESRADPRQQVAASCETQRAEGLRALPALASLHFVRLGGEPVCGPSLGQGGFDPTLAATAIRRGTLVLRAPVRDPSGEFVVPAYRAVFLPDGPALLIARIRLSSIYPSAEDRRFRRGERVGVIGPDGTVLARYPDPDRWIGRDASHTDAYRAIRARSGHGAFEERGLDGVPRIVGLAPFLDTEAGTLHVWVAVPRSALAEDATAELVLAIAIGVGIVATMLLAAGGWLDRAVLAPIQSLSYAARRIAKGDLDARAVLPHAEREIARLGDAFNSMAESLHAEKRQIVLMQRALRVLSTWGRALGDDAHDDELQEVMCRAIVEQGGYLSASVHHLGRDSGPDLLLAPVSVVRDAVGGKPTTIVGSGHPATAAIARRAMEAGRAVVAEDDAAASDAAVPSPYRRAAFPVEVDGRVFGALAIEASEDEAFGRGESALLAELAGTLSSALTLRLARWERESLDRSLAGVRSELLQSRRRHDVHIRRTLADAIEAVAATVEARDPYTAGHQRRVAELAVAIAEELNLPDDIVEGIRLAAMVHDIGKIRVPAELLARPGRLTEAEWAVVRTHPQVGYGILKGLDFPWPVAITVLQHHERIDGSGYPNGVEGGQILLEARIVAVADMVEAMATDRPYRPARGRSVALQMIREQRGRTLDPEVVDACLRVAARPRPAEGALAWLLPVEAAVEPGA